MIKQKLIQDNYIIYDNKSIILKRDNLSKILCNVCHSNPSINIARDKIIYIAPLEWEQLGDLMLYDLHSENLEKLEIPDIPINSTIKKAEWLNSHKLILIIGHAYGTVSLGGDLYTYDLIKKELNKKIELTQYEEIKEFKVKENKIYLEKVVFDMNFNKSSIKKIIIERNDIDD